MSIRESLRLILSRFYDVTTADGCESANQILNKKTEKQPDLVILDVMMPGIGGLGLLENWRKSHPELPILMLTASNSIQTAVKAMKIGAVDYLSKPYDVDELISLINEVLRDGASGKTAPKQLSSQAHLRSVTETRDFGALFGKSKVMKELYNQIEQVSASEAAVLICGESGTGKELVAREIHNRSSKNAGEFVVLNSASIDEVQLFGEGSKQGLVELAHNGSLFIDEIGNLSVDLQAKLLRFLENKEYLKKGEVVAKRSETRVLASTQYNLEEKVQDGSFRSDLLYRVGVIKIKLPKLCQREGDIIPTFNSFVNSHSKLYAGKKIELSETAIKALENYNWPGNIRELENLAESLLALSPNQKVELKDLPRRFREANTDFSIENEVLEGRIPFEEAEKAFEKELITKALKQNNYVQTKAAETLGITRRILKYKMDKLGINPKKAN